MPETVTDDDVDALIREQRGAGTWDGMLADPDCARVVAAWRKHARRLLGELAGHEWKPPISWPYEMYLGRIVAKDATFGGVEIGGRKYRAREPVHVKAGEAVDIHQGWAGGVPKVALINNTMVELVPEEQD